MKEHNCGVALSSLSKVMDKRVIAKLVWPVCQLPIGERRHVYPNRSIIHKECYLRAQDKGADVNVTVKP